MAELPSPRGPGRYRIAVVCLGNICRSPMAHVVLGSAVAGAGLEDRVEVVSAGTADYHVGGPMDRRAAAVLTASGYDASRHRARQFERSWHDDADVVLAMDAANREDLVALGGALDGRLLMFRDFDPEATDGDRDVPDPYYGEEDGFDDVMAIVERSSAEVVRRLAAVLA